MLFGSGQTNCGGEEYHLAENDRCPLPYGSREAPFCLVQLGLRVPTWQGARHSWGFPIFREEACVSPPQLQSFKNFSYSLREESGLRPRLLCSHPYLNKKKTGYSVATFTLFTSSTPSKVRRNLATSSLPSRGRYHDIHESVRGQNRNGLVTNTPTYVHHCGRL